MNDKTKHIIAGLLIALAIGLPVYLESNVLFCGMWAALAGVIAGAVKEYTDMSHEGSVWSWKDFGFTCLGVAISAVIIVLMHFAKG